MSNGKFMVKSGLWRLIVAALVLIGFGSALGQEPVPDATISGNPEGFIGTGVSVPVQFENDGDATGYGPYVDLIIPEGSSLTFTGSDYLGQSLNDYETIVVPAGGTIDHPFHGEIEGLTPGDTIVILELPFGSVTGPQHPFDFDLQFDLSPDAPVNASQDIQVVGGFRYGDDALDNPAADPPLRQETPGSGEVDPLLLQVDKFVLADDHDTPIGTSFQHTFAITVDIAPDQSINPFTITDQLPESLVYLAGDGVRVTSDSVAFETPDISFIDNAGSSCEADADTEDIGPCEDASLVVDFPGGVTADAGSAPAQLRIEFDFYIDVVDWDGNPTGAHATDQGLNIATVNGTWTGNDAHLGGQVLEELFEDDQLTAQDQLELTNAHGEEPASHEDEHNGTIRLQKHVLNAPGGVAAIGDTLEFELNFQVSDPSVFGDVIVTDVLPDGLSYVAGSAEMHITRNGSDVFAADNVSPVVTGDDNIAEQTLAFNISALVGGPDDSALLLGACVPDGGGAVDCDVEDRSSTEGTITFQAVVDRAYRVTPGSVVQNDVLENTASITGNVHYPGDLAVVPGVTDEDGDEASVTIAGAAALKSIHAIGDETELGERPNVTAGDIVTFELDITLGSLSFRNLVVSDFLPLPVFNTANATTVDFLESEPAGIPSGWTAWFADGTDSRITAMPGTPASNPDASVDEDTNSVVFRFSDYTHASDNTEARMVIRLAVPVVDTALADGMYVTNLLRAEDQNSANSDAVAQQLVQLRYTRPELNISNGVVDVQNATSYTGDGVGVDISGPITSENRSEPQFNYNVEGLDAGDVVTYLVIVENDGRGRDGAFDVRLYEQLPDNLAVADVDTDAVLTVRNGDGTELMTFAAGEWDSLFTPDGLLLQDNVLDRGLNNDGSAVTDGSNILYFTYDVALPDGAENHSRFDTISHVQAYAAQADGNNLTVAATEDTLGLVNDDVYVTIEGPNPEKSIVATSEQGEGHADYVTIGEIVRYRLVVTIPEGTSTDLVITDELPRGMRYVASEGVQIASVAADTGAFSGLDVTGSVQNYLATENLPTVLHPDSSPEHATVDSVTVGSVTIDGANTSDSITINLGDVVNSASDEPREQLVLEFNALVVNATADNGVTHGFNDDRRRKNNTASQISGPTDSRVTQDSGTVTTRIVEPRLRVRKSVAAPDDADAGDTVVYTIVVDQNPSGADDSATAHDVTITDVLPEYFTYVSHTISDNGNVVEISTGALSQTSTGEDMFTVTATELPVDGLITITITGTLDSNVPSNLDIANTARAHASSLPDGGTPATDTENNGTGSTTPGAAVPAPTDGAVGATGDANGERGYNASDNDEFTTQAIAPTKTIAATSEQGEGDVETVTIGEIIRYRLTINIPEGVSNGVTITDVLPAGLEPIDLTGTDHQTRVSFHSANATDLVVDSDLTAAIIDSACSTGAAASTVLPDDRIVRTANSVTFDLGDINNRAEDDSPDCAVIEFNALVTDVGTNFGSSTLDNPVSATANGNEIDGEDHTVTVVEPDLTVEKSVSSVDPDPTYAEIEDGNASNVDVGNRVTFEAVISNPAGDYVSTAWYVTFVDELDDQYEFVSGTYTVPGRADPISIAAPTAPGNTIEFSVDDDLEDLGGAPFGLAPDEEIVVTYIVDVLLTEPPAEAFGLDIPNEAEVSGKTLPYPPTSDNETGSVRPDDSERYVGDEDDALVVLAEPELGLAKELSAGPDAQDEGVYALEFTFIVQNTGSIPLTGVQLEDDLAAHFEVADDTMTIDELIVSSVDLAGAVNEDYGTGGNWNLFSPAGIDLDPGESVEVTLAAQVTLLPPVTLPAEFENLAVATGTTPGGIPAEPRESADGDNPDAEPEVTVVEFAEDAAIEVTKELTGDVTTNMDGSFNIIYLITAENTGEVTLRNVSLVDNLEGVYGASGAWSVTDVVLASGPATVAVNWPDGYDGSADDELLAADATLAPGEVAEVLVNLMVEPENSHADYTNTVVASGESPLGQEPTDAASETHTFEADPSLGIGTCLPTAGITPVTGALGQYDVTFTVHLQNYGNVQLHNVQAELDLADIFADADDWEFMDASVAAGSLVSLNDAFDGEADLDLLAADVTLFTVEQTDLQPDDRNDQVTVTVEVRVIPGSTLGYGIQVTGEGESPIVPVGATDGWLRNVMSDDDCVMDAAPTDPFDPTPLEFPNDPLIGVAKEFTNLEAVEGQTGTFDFQFDFVLRNYGNVPLSGVSLTDNFSAVFQAGDTWAITDIEVIEGGSGLTAASVPVPADPVGNFDLLDPGSSTLGTVAQESAEPAGEDSEATVRVSLQVTPEDAGHEYFNTALAEGTGPTPPDGGTPPVTQDDSVDGDDPDFTPGTDPADPDNNDGDPNNNDSPTPFTFESPLLGLAKDAPATFDFAGDGTLLPNADNQGEGTYRIGYTFYLVNYGDVELTELSLTDDLAAIHTLLGTDGFISATAIDGTLEANPDYDGVTDTEILAPNQTLAYTEGTFEVGTVSIMVTVSPGALLESGTLDLENEATTSGVSPGGQTVTDGSYPGTNPDPYYDDDPASGEEPDPNAHNEPTVVQLTEAPLLALSKNLESLENLGTGTYRVTFGFILENQGDVLLTDVQLTDEIDAAFNNSPFTIFSLSADDPPLTAADSTGAAATFELLDASQSSLVAGESATVTLVVDVTPGERIYTGSEPTVFENTALAEGTSPAGRTVDDTSNDGTTPDPTDDTPTEIVILEDPVLGVAKSAVVNPLGDGTYEVDFTFTIHNYGDVEVRNLQLTDDLVAAFGPAADITVYSIFSPTLTTNVVAPDPATPTAYDGETHLDLLMGVDTLAVNETATVELALRVDPEALGTYENQADVTGTSPGGEPVHDRSTDGDDPDPNGDDVPDEDTPTPVIFGENPEIALAKAATVMANADGSYEVTLVFTVHNTGDVPLSGLQISDPLDDLYANTNLTPANIQLQSGDMTVNPNYDGQTDANLLSGTDTMPVAAQWTATIHLSNLISTGETSLENSALATGTPPHGTPVDDPSNDGDDPIPGEDVPTPIELTQQPQVALAKSASLVMNADSTFTVTFTFTVRNTGNTPLLGLQISDGLAEYYTHTDLTPAQISTDSSRFATNAAYDGQSDDQLLSGSDQLAVGETGTATLVLDSISATGAETTIANSALAHGRSPDGTPTDDPSNDGTTPEPGEDVPTIVELRENPLLGIAKSAGVLLESDGTYTVTFDFILRNYGNVPLTDLSMTDSLADFYADAGLTAANVTVTSSDLPVNAGYNGQSDLEVLGAGAGLDVGEEASVTITLSNLTVGARTDFTNQADGEGTGPGGTPTPPESSTDGDDPDPDGNGDPTDNDDPTPVTLVPAPLLGTAKDATVTMNADGSYSVLIDIRLANLGNAALNDVQVTDDLTDFYTHTDLTPAAVTVTSSDFTVNPAFDGDTVTATLLAGNTLEVGAIALVTITLDPVTPLTQFEFDNSALGSGTPPGGPPVNDPSNPGEDPVPGDDTPTPIILAPNPVIGAAKSAEVLAGADGTWDVVMTFTIGNYGNTVLDNIQLRDDLTELYEVTDLSSAHIELESTDFTVNAGFDGLADPRLLAPTGNSLGLGEFGTITLTLAGISVTEHVDVLNTAIATGESPGGDPARPDRSTDGDDPDPDGDGDPGNNNTPTPIRIGLNPLLGLAKSATTTQAGDGSYDITFTLLVRNYGDAPLTDLSITDPLTDFYDNTSLSAANVTVTSADLTVNPAYDGLNDTELLAAGNVLQIGADATLTINLAQVVPDPGVTRIDNQALASGTSPDGRRVADTSTDGSDPDPDGSGPHNHSVPTPVFFGAEAALLLTKDAAPGPYGIGDRVPYTVTVTNPNDVAISINLEDATPPATTYIADTAVFEPESAAPSEGAEPRQAEPGLLTWRAIVIPAGESITVTYELRIAPGAQNPLINTVTAQGESGNGASITAQANASVEIDQGVFDLDSGTLIGRVYLDVNRNNTFDEGIDVPLENARVVLANGWQTLTDEQGNYAFRELESGTWTVMVDQVTAPYQPAAHPEQLRDPRQHRVSVQGVTVSDFPFHDLAGLTSTRRETFVNFGPIELHKYQVLLGDTTRVVIELSSLEAWPPLLITDPVPDGEALEFEVELTGAEPVIITHDLPGGTQLTDPEIEWSNR